MRTFANCLGTCQRRKPWKEASVIAMTVGHKYVADGPAGNGFPQRVEMFGLVGAGINHRQRFRADKIGVGAFKSERTWIWSGDTDQIRKYFNRFAVLRLKCAVEFHSGQRAARFQPAGSRGLIDITSASVGVDCSSAYRNSGTIRRSSEMICALLSRVAAA